MKFNRNMDKQHRMVWFTGTVWQQGLWISKFWFINKHRMCLKLQKGVIAEKLSPVISERAFTWGMTHFQVIQRYTWSMVFPPEQVLALGNILTRILLLLFQGVGKGKLCFHPIDFISLQNSSLTASSRTGSSPSIF